jgi:hypothetical protein
LKREVLDVHDIAMPLMVDIYEAKRSLKEKATSPGLSTEQRSNMEKLIAELDVADKGMRVWMREFSNVKTTGVDEEQAIKSLNVEMEKIKKVKTDMEQSLEHYRAFTSAK